mmetsp:Transcript_12047/g.21802  ORF Transcript_12047/g.21802 Transcript_12047/m.21802 type:complete len:216 (-) Transcript_12047:127-774(-)
MNSNDRVEDTVNDKNVYMYRKYKEHLGIDEQCTSNQQNQSIVELEDECETRETECIFCSIVKGNSPAYIVNETPSTLAVLDVNPVAKGHVLVIPKKHRDNVLHLSFDETSQLFIAVRIVAHAVTLALNAHGFNLGVNTGKAAGQTVIHAHVHVIPRFGDDGFWCVREPQSMPQNQLVSSDEQQQICDKIRETISNLNQHKEYLKLQNQSLFQSKL